MLGGQGAGRSCQPVALVPDAEASGGSVRRWRRAHRRTGIAHWASPVSCSIWYRVVLRGLERPLEPRRLVDRGDLTLDPALDALDPVGQRLDGGFLRLVAAEDDVPHPGPEPELGDGGGSAVMRVVGAEPIDPGVELSLGEGPRGENAVERIGLVGLEE